MNKYTRIAERGCFLVTIIGGTTSLFILIIIIGLFKSCFGEKIDPMDDTYMKEREMYDRHAVYDSTSVGFDFLWYTTNAVSRERADEIRSRPHIRKAQKEFIETVADHFNHDFFNADIYDVAEYAKKFDVDPDVRLVNVFVIGQRLEDQYLRPNPNLPDGGCTEPCYGTDQGVLYIKEIDIYSPSADSLRTYRYWECWRTSSSDERYTHFTESERKQGKYGKVLYIPKYNSQ